MKITPSTLTINQLLSSPNEQFSVPAYQRRYAWTDKQLGELFDDIDYLNPNDTHLLSTIVFLTDNHTAGINQVEVVDGQQRITSISILLKVLQDKFIEDGQDDIGEEIQRLLICKGIDKKERNKLLLGELDNADYAKLLEKKDWNEIVNKNLVNAYNKFSEWLKKCNEIYAFYHKLINNLMVIRLDVGYAKDAYRLFESINNRGLKLSPTDIIKNFLLGNASNAGEETLRRVRNYWRDLIINLDNINTDDFFRQMLAGILTRKIPSSKLVDEFKDYCFKTVKEAKSFSNYHIYEEPYDSEDEDESIENSELEETPVRKTSLIEFAKNLKVASAIYAEIINRKFESEKINRSLYNLQRIRSLPSYTFLLNFFQRNLPDKTQIKILKMLEVFMLRRHICEYRTNELEDIFSKLVQVTDKNIEQQVKERLEKSLPPDAEFEERLARYNFKGNIDRAKYMLEYFEYDIINDKGEYSINGGEAVHLEHIIPQVIDTKKAKKELGDWVEYLGDKARALHNMNVDLIGNYTLLASDLNIIASNNPFLAKKNEYKKSNIQLTKMIAGKSQFKFKQVSERSKEFAKRAVEIWKI